MAKTKFPVLRVTSVGVKRGGDGIRRISNFTPLGRISPHALLEDLTPERIILALREESFITRKEAEVFRAENVLDNNRYWEIYEPNDPIPLLTAEVIP